MNYTIYENKQELKEQNPTLFEIANNNLELDEDDSIYIYASPEDYAKYYIQEGYYAETFVDKELYDFIDYIKLGNDMIRRMNKEENYYDKETNVVISLTK